MHSLYVHMYVHKPTCTAVHTSTSIHTTKVLINAKVEIPIVSVYISMLLTIHIFNWLKLSFFFA